ncbi:RRQRL motif-containing zinc-binding protein [Nonomuraea sp. ATR24]|uniref:RRQRL motif-containing zinc-binding protein n=1 Tax=Nonomuraea sp. ATR24 TaxID=1676744 RepID=UPI0035C0ED34
MHSIPASGARIPQLERLNATPGTRVVFYDPTGSQYGLPTYPWKWAPKNLKTRRQLAALGLRPGGQAPVAQILWRKGGRFAYLYDIAHALPKRKPSRKQLDTLDKAQRVRRMKRSAS